MLLLDEPIVAHWSRRLIAGSGALIKHCNCSSTSHRQPAPASQPAPPAPPAGLAWLFMASLFDILLLMESILCWLLFFIDCRSAGHIIGSSRHWLLARSLLSLDESDRGSLITASFQSLCASCYLANCCCELWIHVFLTRKRGWCKVLDDDVSSADVLLYSK